MLSLKTFIYFSRRIKLIKRLKFNALQLALLTITSVFVNGQNKIQGFVLDKRTFAPLPYATIGAINQQYGTYSDTSGLFTLHYLNGNDSLKVSYLGYKSLYTTVQDLQRNSKIHLEAIPVQLKDVVVSPKKVKTKEMRLGFFSKKIGQWEVPSYAINVYATFIPFPKKGGDIVMKSISFSYHLAAKNLPLRVRILKVMNNGAPGDDILDENIIFSNYKPGHKQIANIDISKYNVIMPSNGVFIALEWINMDRTPVISMNQAGKNGPYINVIETETSSNSKWFNAYNQSKWKENSKSHTFAIGLTVVNYSD